jgi:hypothetical protein
MFRIRHPEGQNTLMGSNNWDGGQDKLQRSGFLVNSGAKKKRRSLVAVNKLFAV